MSARAAPRIAVVGPFVNSAGSISALAGYYWAAVRAGFDLRASTLGYVDSAVRQKIPVADADWHPDLMVLLFESSPYLSQETVAHIERVVPRSRRLVVDCDGVYSPPTRSGSDTNHPGTDSRIYWAELFARLSDTILQPCLGPLPTGVQRFLFYGVDLAQSRAGNAGSEKTYDIAYVGNNWYRWYDMSWLCKGLASVRSKLGRLAVFGKWWDGTRPDTQLKFDTEKLFYSDPLFFQEHGVETYPAVPFVDVEETMGRARLHPVLVRPVLNTLGLVTPRMFETFMANTVPILPPYLKHAPTLYGSDITPLYLGYRPAEAVMEILTHYGDYLTLTREVRARLMKEHSYDVRLAELLSWGTGISAGYSPNDLVAVDRSPDIVPLGDGLVPGRGWYPYEACAGETFRWVSNDAEVMLTRPTAEGCRWRVEVEPGPGMGGQPFLLQVLNERGETVSTTRVQGRQSVSVVLPASYEARRVFRLHVDGGGRPAPNDRRTLNFRVFCMTLEPNNGSDKN